MDEEIDKIVEAEDKEIEKLKNTDESEDIYACPKCKRLVDDKDFNDEDAISQIAATSMSDRIDCPKCGYVGIPIEMSRSDYEKWIKS